MQLNHFTAFILYFLVKVSECSEKPKSTVNGKTSQSNGMIRSLHYRNKLYVLVEKCQYSTENRSQGTLKQHLQQISKS